MPPARRTRGQARQGMRLAHPQLRPRRNLQRPRRLRDDERVDRPAAPSSDSEPEGHLEPDVALNVLPAPQDIPPVPPPQPDQARVEALEEALQRQEQQLNALMVGVDLPQHPLPAPVSAAAGSPPPPVPAAAEAPQVPNAPVPIPQPQPLPQQALPLQPDPLMSQIVGAAVAGNQIPQEHLNLGSFLPQDIQNAITSKQYVDLKSLSTDPSPASSVVFSVDTSQANPQVSLNRPVKLISNFREWMSLFATYAAVYTSAHPQEAPALFTYMVRIFELSQEGGYLWRTYDEAFRRLKAKYPAVLFQEHNPQLLNTLRHKDTIASNSRPFPQQNQFRGKPATPPPPPRACHQYYFRGACVRNSCPYNHICARCHSPGHSFLTCFKSRPNNSSNVSSKRS